MQISPSAKFLTSGLLIKCVSSKNFLMATWSRSWVFDIVFSDQPFEFLCSYFIYLLIFQFIPFTDPGHCALPFSSKWSRCPNSLIHSHLPADYRPSMVRRHEFGHHSPCPYETISTQIMTTYYGCIGPNRRALSYPGDGIMSSVCWLHSWD